MKKNNKAKKTNFSNIILSLILLLLITTGVSFAFFTATISGAEDSTTITIGGGTMNITYSGGSAITASNIYPRTDPWITKSFTMTGNNTTASVMKYKVTLVVQTNTFSNGTLEYKLASTNTGSNGVIIPAVSSFTDIAAGASSVILGNGQFTAATGGNKIHTYTLTIYLLDNGFNQNTEQGKSFTAYLKTEGVQ